MQTKEEEKKLKNKKVSSHPIDFSIFYNFSICFHENDETMKF